MNRRATVVHRSTPWLIALALATAATWTFAWVEARHRTSFFDDAFIYLAIARNVVEAQTAQIFPVADNPGLIASSPLRLLLLVPSYATAAAIHGDAPSHDVARLSFFVSGVFTALLFLPFFIHRFATWLALAAIAGLLSSTTNSMLQMEGAPVFWGTCGLVHAFGSGAQPRRLALLLAILFLARVELGVAASIALAIAWHRRATPRRDARTMLFVLATVAAGWILIASALGVWPVPTTFLTKVRTGELRLFGPPFARTLAETLAHYLPLPSERTGQRVVAGCGAAAVIILLSWRPGGRLAALLLVGLFAILARGPGNFAWYHENLLLAAIASMAAVHCVETTRPAWRTLVGAAAICLVLANAATRLGRNDKLPWGLSPPPAHGGSLVWLADQHMGEGQFRFRDASHRDPITCFVSVAEIGIISYFAGPTCWLFDSSGLAQAGQLRGVGDSWLTLAYPTALLRTAHEELALVRGARELPLCEAHFVATQPTPERAFRVIGAPWALLPVAPK
jgi:hypothetical protein